MFALDLGTTYSRYAFSNTSQFKTKPLEINCNRVGSGGNPIFFVTKDENKELKAVGYEAEEEFANICNEGDQNGYFLFRGFYPDKVFHLIRNYVYYTNF